MSRIAKNPVIVPSGVEVTVSAKEITVKGPLGVLIQPLTSNITVVREGDGLQCAAAGDSIQANAMSGTMRALLANMVKGVSQGFERKLTLVGVGYRAQAKGDVLSLSLGFSHPVEHQMPIGVKVETPTQTEIVIRGIDKQQVGQVAADVRSYRKPEPYKGKGVRYSDEVVVIKETKKK
ncbi:MAG: 50S ribosomal protein L6 [Sulfurimicrobium sp.]|jgi:large subunit ribosomal protein L6|nr:50S ribosomal protein L6 [Sulfurimicrobium sp.]MDP1704195.1 50S ribosomal protein L6 [Sulfurimicrobium sp.]MDP1897816.1 50S ribosomal protein L6 [Sulfurimicrobium sp.]MDP2198950.1 50S ribosomal protein L6 [Sulfurimicrobium sp.]MDP2961228.1 50S ribosomal protein L6 [Sulfurimicrobium sp.]